MDPELRRLLTERDYPINLKQLQQYLFTVILNFLENFFYF